MQCKDFFLKDLVPWRVELRWGVELGEQRIGEIFHLLTHFSNGCITYVWTRPALLPSRILHISTRLKLGAELAVGPPKKDYDTR